VIPWPSLRFSYRGEGFERNTVREIEDRMSIVPLMIVLLMHDCNPRLPLFAAAGAVTEASTEHHKLRWSSSVRSLGS
jgi:hypothetical protein